jgi:hypothetical protein
LPQIRVQTPDLAEPAAYRTQQVVPDNFARPRANPGAGSQLTDLAQALAGVRPALNNALQPAFENYQANEMFAGQKYADMLKQGSVSAGDYAQARKGWSIYRIQGLELAQGRDAANDYNLEAATALHDLAKQANPNPADAQKVLQDLRHKYAQQAEGSGQIWQKSFGQYADNYDRDLLANYQHRVEAYREKQAVNMASHEAAVDITALASNPDPQAIKEWQRRYFDPAHFHSPLSGDQMTEAVATGFRIAASNAAANGRFDTADHVLAMLKEAETAPGQKLAQTEYGIQAINEILHDVFVEKQSQNATEQDVKRAKLAGLESQAWDYTKNQLALPPEKRSAFMDQRVLDGYAAVGVSPQQAQAQYEFFLKPSKVEAKEERKDNIATIKDRIAELQIAYHENPTPGALMELRKGLGNLHTSPEADGPQSKEAILTAMRDVEKQGENFSDDGLLKNDVYKNGLSEITTFATAQNSALSKALHDANPDEAGFPKGLTVSVAQGEPAFEATDAVAEMKADYLSKMHSLAQQGVTNITIEQSNAIVKPLQEKLKERIQEIITQAKGKKDTPPSDGSSSTPSSGPTQPAPKVFFTPEGEPTLAYAQELLSQRSTVDDVFSTFTDKMLGGVSAGTYNAGKAMYMAHDDIATSLSYIRPGASLASLRTSTDPQYAEGQLNSKFVDTTRDLEQLEKTNKEWMSAAKNGLPGSAGAVAVAPPWLNLIGTNMRQSALDWARARTRWFEIVKFRGLTPAELEKYPASWVKEDGIPYPHVPIFDKPEEMTPDALGKVQKKFKLSDQEMGAFYAAQRGFIDERNRLARTPEVRSRFSQYDPVSHPELYGGFNPLTGGN